MRGVFDREGKAFKCDVAGNDKNYGFNIWYGQSDEVMVFEAAIDLMSYVEIRGDYVTNKLDAFRCAACYLFRGTPESQQDFILP